MSVLPALCLLVFLALPLSSQAGRPLAPGDVVRWESGSRRYEGVVRAPVTRDAPLRVSPRGNDTDAELPWSAQGLQVRVREGRRTKGMLLGAGVGAAIGVVAGLASGSDEPGWFALSATDKALGFGIIFGVLGAPIGAITAPGAQWTDVAPSSGAARVSWRAGPGRVGVRLTF